MTLEDLGNIGEFVGAVGVVVSLVYLSIQIRRGTDTQRTSTYESVVSDFAAINRTMASDPDLAILYVRAMEDFDSLDATQKARVSQLFFATFHSFENMYYQHKKGFLETDVWLGWQRLMLTYYSRDGFQVWWKFRRDVFSSNFAAFLESEHADIVVPSYYDVTVDTTADPIANVEAGTH